MWQAQFPDSVRVADRWLCDVTVFNGSEKFVVTVTYDRSIDECLPQLLAAVAKRDAQTLKPPAPIPTGTLVSLTPALDPITGPLSKEAQARADWFTRYRASIQQKKADALPPELQADFLPEFLADL